MFTQADIVVRSQLTDFTFDLFPDEIHYTLYTGVYTTQEITFQKTPSGCTLTDIVLTSSDHPFLTLSLTAPYIIDIEASDLSHLGDYDVNLDATAIQWETGKVITKTKTVKVLIELCAESTLGMPSDISYIIGSSAVISDALFVDSVDPICTNSLVNYSYVVNDSTGNVVSVQGITYNSQ